MQDLRFSTARHMNDNLMLGTCQNESSNADSIDHVALLNGSLLAKPVQMPNDHHQIHEKESCFPIAVRISCCNPNLSLKMCMH